MEENKMINILVIWRGKKLNVEINYDATLKEFGHKLQHLTNVKPDTLRLLTPRSSDNSSKLLTPFSDDHSSLSLKESSIHEGKSIRMMGVFEDEIKEVSHDGTKADLRIAGFDEDDRRTRQRMLIRARKPLKLPQGAYIFCDFRTLHLPGIELNPPPSEALKRMHMLAADPGIIAIMNKHRWRVGIMTEMAPVGYVGVSPKCILGFNKNQGEEISLRLRTDDLKGFRKYESIKKTLLHELAHMVYSEHDSLFYALDKQLNQEAANLDWTRSRSHTLSGFRHSDHYEEEFYEETTGSISQKLGGSTMNEMASARATSIAAAYRRLVVASTDSGKGHEVHVEPDPDDSGCEMHVETDPDDSIMKIELPMENDKNPDSEPDHDDDLEDQDNFEDHKDSWSSEAMETEPFSGIHTTEILYELDLDAGDKVKSMPYSTYSEPDPDDSEASNSMDEPDPDDSLATENLNDKTQLRVSQERHAVDTEIRWSMEGLRNFVEPDLLSTELGESFNQANKIPEENGPVDSGLKRVAWERGNNVEPDPDDTLAKGIMEHDGSQAIETEIDASCMEKAAWGGGNNIQHDPNNSIGNSVLQHEPDPDERNDRVTDTSNSPYDMPDPNDQEIKRIQDPVSIICNRLQKTIDMLKSEVRPAEATLVLQTLFKIIGNVIEHPGEIKFRRLRKTNPQFQRNVAKYKAAMEVLFLVGFDEDTVSDEIGRSETYVVLKRNDPGLLWLVKSSLETCIAY